MTNVCEEYETGLRILIVEDREDSADVLAMLLRMYGHQVEIARNGLIALDTELSRHHDVILLDIALPGMDGWQVAKRLKEYPSPKSPFIVAVTGYGRAEDKHRSAEAGIDLHLTKPVDPALLKDLLDRFEQVIGGRDQDPLLLSSTAAH